MGYVGSMAKSSRKLTLSVFDFDDTLVRTDAKVHINHDDGTVSYLTPSQFARYRYEPGDEFDYREFEALVNPRPMPTMVSRLKRAIKDGHHVVVLSARISEGPIHDFMSSVGVTVNEVVALNDPRPTVKARWIERAIAKRKPSLVRFFDDAPGNVLHVHKLASTHRHIRFVVRLL